ncbi:MAG TPA: P-loop NTPase fold protein [Coleofasciculaceae cyanobacterium]
MALDLRKFYQACNPSKTLNLGNAEDRQYYIDFSSVRGGEIIQELERTITLFSPDEPTCQLFTGHIGCGKSTELLRLKNQLEQQGFHVVYFESSQDLDLADVDISDILLAIARQVSSSLEAIQIKLKPGYFANLFTEVKDFLQTPVDLNFGAELSLGIAKITAQTKDSPKLRGQLRQYLEPRTNGILEAINQELIERANTELKRRGKQGLVVIVDNLDRVDSRPLASGRLLPEYLFIDRGEQLRRLNCHVVYTIPLALIFSNESEVLASRLGGGVDPKMLPMVPVHSKDGRECAEGMALLRQMVLARAFPHVNPYQRVNFIQDVFDSSETLDRLCRGSGGHVRNLLGLLYSCLQKKNPPISLDCVEKVIRERRNKLVLGIESQEWELLRQVREFKAVKQGPEYQTLLRNMLVFEYRNDEEAPWFDVNPVLAEAKELQP